MGLFSFLKDMIDEEMNSCKNEQERLSKYDASQDLDDDVAARYALLDEDAYENNYDSEEIKRIKQKLIASGNVNPNMAYKIAEEKHKLKQDNIKKYYNKN